MYMYRSYVQLSDIIMYPHIDEKYNALVSYPDPRPCSERSLGMRKTKRAYLNM